MAPKIKISAEAIKQLTESKEASALLQEVCDKLAADANATLDEGEGYEVSSRTGRYSSPSADRVYTGSPHATASNAKRNTLLRLLNG